MTEHFILYRLPVARGRAYHAWSIEHDPMLAVKRATPGYIAQEIAFRLTSHASHNS